MSKHLTLGSLFDGSGGFPLGGMLCGVKPLWASEIEPFPIRVTSKRMPDVKHYGDVSKMDGGKVEPVDIISFGSPCQDMSVAGKRSGLDGSRSSLFYEAVRIIKEMRKATDGKYPRWAIWENVPGAFSSSSGDDFRCVLESLCGVIYESVDIPKPKKWPSAGSIVGDNFSLAWRVLDAQYWGVPQRRKRIYLVADFAGGSAGKVLFESEGLSGYSAESFRSWQTTAGSVTGSIGASGFDGYNGSLTGDKEATLGVNCGMSTGRNGVAYSMTTGSFPNVAKEKVPPLLARDFKDATVVTEPSFRIGRDAFNQGANAQYKPAIEEEVQPTIVAKGPGAVAAPHGFYPQMKAECVTLTEEKSGCLVNGTNPGFQNGVLETGYTVRRLTPTECARLQGFPDWWCSALGTEKPTDEEVYFWYKVWKTYSELTGCKPKSDKQLRAWLQNPYSDASEYKMWGNGVALPCVFFVMSGIVYYTQKEAEKIGT